MSTKWHRNFHPKNQKVPVSWDDTVPDSASVPSLIWPQRTKSSFPAVLGSASRKKVKGNNSDKNEGGKHLYLLSLWLFLPNLKITLRTFTLSLYASHRRRRVSPMLSVTWHGISQMGPHILRRFSKGRGKNSQLLQQQGWLWWVQRRGSCLETRTGNAISLRGISPSGSPLCPSFWTQQAPAQHVLSFHSWHMPVLVFCPSSSKARKRKRDKKKSTAKKMMPLSRNGTLGSLRYISNDSQ